MKKSKKSNPWDVFPEKFLDKLPKIIGKNDLKSVLKSFCEQKPTTFRINTLKATKEEVENTLNSLKIAYTPVEWYKDAYILQGEKRELLETDLYNNGKIYVQSLSSMIPPLVLNPKPTDKVLDITAAPGSKTTQMAALMQNEGSIVANDRSKIRLFKLKANLNMQGVTNVHVTHLPGQAFWKSYPEYFDKTLVDVPCSMEGRFNCFNEKTYRDWKNGKVKELVQIQRWLLRSAISATKPGGTIIYSTCTLSPEENEGIIDWILQKEKDVLDVLPTELKISGMIPGLVSFNEKKYDERLEKTVRILPSKTMEGFYIAKLIKLKSSIPSLTDTF